MKKSIENPNLSLLNIGYSDFYANWNWKAVCSPFARIYYVKNGNAQTLINGQSYPLKSKHLYLIPPFTLHDDLCDDYFSLFYIHFYEQALNKESLFDQFEMPIGVEATGLDLELIERLQQINPNRELGYFDPKIYDNQPTFSSYIAANKKMTFYDTIETSGILYQLLSRFLRKSTIKSLNIDFRINGALKYVHENIDKDISVSFLAGLSCVSDDHFIRLFKKEMKTTPIKYIQSKKMEKAQLLLMTTNKSIRNIAIELSMDNISYFNKIFKHYLGKTPGKYREEYL